MIPTKVTIGPRRYGLAGQYSYDVEVSYKDKPDGQSISSQTTFIGSIYGGPVYVGDHLIDTSVKWRCGGILTPDFIREFYNL